MGGQSKPNINPFQPMKTHSLIRRLVSVCLLTGITSSVAQTLDVTNGLQLWLKADAGVTTDLNGGVTQWEDQSGEANHAVQFDGNRTPVLVNGALNNKPVLRFDGVDDFLDVADSPSLSGTGDMSSFFIIKFDDFATFRAVWGKTAGSGGNQPAPTDIYALPNDGRLRVFRGNGTGIGNSSATTTQPLPANAYLAVGFDVSGSTLNHYLNNQPNGSGAATASVGDGDTPLKIGTRTDFVTKLKGNLAELLIYSRALSAAERNDVFAYFRSKYGLNVPPTVTLAATPPGPNVNVSDVVTLTATPTDPDGTIARVEFLANGAPVGTANIAPYSVRVRFDSPGDVTFTARATDDNGASEDSAPLVLTAAGGIPTELSVTNGLQLWLKASTGLLLGPTGGVTNWADQSGNGNDAIQSDETRAPRPTPGPNGPSLAFDGVDDFMDVVDSDSISITGDITTFFVVKFADFVTYRGVWGKTAGAAGNIPAPTDLYTSPGSGQLNFFRGDGSAFGAVTAPRGFGANTFVVGAAEMAGTAVRLYYNGVLNGSGAITAPVADGNGTLRLGSRADGVTRMKGEMAEVLIFNHSLSDAERRAVEVYLGQKYAVGVVAGTNSTPVIAITSPAGPLLQAPANITVSAVASDTDGSIASVQLFRDGELLGTDTAAPYAVNLNLNYGGRATFTAVATDNLGAQISAAPVEICVQGPGAPAGLVGYWPLDGNANAVIGRNGDMIGGPAPAIDRNGIVGGALFFDGAMQQNVQIPGGGGLNGARQGTISMWVKWTGSQDDGFGPSYGAVLSRQQNGQFSDNIINLSNADPNAGAVQWRQNGAVTIAGTGAVANDVWRHILITFTETNSELFVDGLSEGTGPGGALHNNPATALAIGAWSGDGGSFATATIDDVAVWNRVLTFDEIQEIAGQLSTPLDLLIAPDCLTIERNGNNVTVRWRSQGVLQSADDIGDTFTDVAGATSPYVPTVLEQRKFYRLRSP